jgi:uncharacterized membrane protein (DUF485 family)
MPKFSLVDVLFKRAPEGWTFISSYPRIFGPPSTFVLTDAQKAALEKRLNRFVLLMSLVVVSISLILGVFASFMFPDLADQLEAGSPGAWLLVSVVFVVLTSAPVSAIFLIRPRVIEPVLCTARRVGPAQPYGFGILIEIIKRYTEIKSSKVLIIWIVVLLLVTYTTQSCTPWLYPHVASSCSF